MRAARSHENHPFCFCFSDFGGLQIRLRAYQVQTCLEMLWLRGNRDSATEGRSHADDKPFLRECQAFGRHVSDSWLAWCSLEL